MTLISIIIPAYNEEDYIRRTLHSIRNQTYQNYEIIVVANGCTDETESQVRKRVADNVRLLSMPKPNVSRARNHGASKAKGEILLFLDADTLLNPDTLQIISNNFSARQAVATTKVRPDSNDLKYRMAMSFKNLYNSSKLYKGCSGALICRREDFDRVNGYDPSIKVKEHRLLTLKLLKLGKYKVMDTHVTTSMRRLKNWGLTKSTYFWIKQFVKDKYGGLQSSEYEKVR